MSDMNLRSVNPRRRDDAAAMAVAVQANLVTLKVAAARRVNQPTDSHSIQTESPGAVHRFREALLDRHAVAAYSDQEMLLRTRQVWGEFAVLCWAFQCNDPHHPPAFAALPSGLGLRCPMELLKKMEVVSNALWRMRHEQRVRFDADARARPDFQRDYEKAAAMPVRVYDVDVRLASPSDLIQCACEHAGMLGAIRWLADDRRTWGEPGIMELPT